MELEVVKTDVRAANGPRRGTFRITNVDIYPDRDVFLIGRAASIFLYGDLMRKLEVCNVFLDTSGCSLSCELRNLPKFPSLL